MDKIFINGLKVSCIIGILPDERVHEQSLIMDVCMEHSLKQAGEKGDLNLSINYARVASFCLDFAKERKAFLLEELAEELCSKILQEFNPSSVTLRLSKPKAVKEALGVGIEITRCNRGR